MRVFKISMLGVVLLALAVGTSEQAGLAQAGCSIMVKPGESIQRAIDAAKEGAVICLTAGMWEENVEIKKSLTLRGAGREQTKIKGKKEDEPVIMIASDAEIEVTIEGLAAAEAKGYREGIEVAGKARVTITNSQISGNEGDGIHMVDSAQATISNSQISGNESAGIFIDYSTRVTITNSQISGNKGMGINMGISAQATISNSQISSNGKLGIWMWSSTQATITNSQISGNEWDGIGMVGSAQATISNSQISGNGYNGIEMWESAQATISNSQISGNKGGGIDIGGSAQATIENNTIQENKMCGIWSSSDKPAQGKGNRMRGNGADLCGNAPAGLRIPLVPPTTKTQLSFPGPYPTLQEAIDALAPGGVITIAAGEHLGGLTIWKPLTLRGAGREEVKFMGAVSLISEAQGVQIEGVTITGSAFTGLLLGGQAKATITNSQVSGNKGGGIGVGGSAQATITNSQISGNGYTGIWMWGSAQAEIRGSTIEGNGTSEDCKKNNYICNGIWLYAKSQVKIIDSTIRNNADWGVGAYLKQCGEYTDDFTGTVTFEDMMLDQIAGNNTSGNQNGMGNPGNHYWNRPDIPDGQVCLP